MTPILGEGDTPLIDVTAALARQGINGPRVSVKCEHLNPTGSFKDRIAARAAAIALERGLRGFFGTSSGNGGAAAAAYAAACGLRAVLLALPDAPVAKLAQIRAAGGTVFLVDGLGSDADATEHIAAGVARLAPKYGFLPFLTGANYAPEIMAGAMGIAAELAEQAAQATRVYAPVGGGGLLGSLGRGYRSLDGPAPQLVGVQPLGCPTMREALAGRPARLTQPTTTALSGVQVAALFDSGAPEAISTSSGHLVEVSDEAAFDAQRILAAAGLLVEPAGALALAGALADLPALTPDDHVVVIASGAGWKDPVALDRLGSDWPMLRRSADDLEAILTEL